jgi:hypothetical protein
VKNEEVLKLIDDVSEILSVLVELKKGGRFREAIEKIDETLQDYFRCDDEFMYSVSEDFLVDVLKEQKGLSSEHLSSLADILTEKGNILLEQNNLKESQRILRNSLRIYYFLNEDQDFFSFKNMNKMVLINEKLAKINIKIEN